jgi:hypothetical protein
MLRREGLVANRKRTCRLYTEQGLQVRTKKRRKLPRRDRIAPQVPARPMQRWSLDFVSDQLADCRRLRVLNIVDDHRAASAPARSSTSRSPARVSPAISTTWRYSTVCPRRSSSITGRGARAAPCSTGRSEAACGFASSNRASRSEIRLRREPERQTPR